jgi:UPF0716 protein FxsA
MTMRDHRLLLFLLLALPFVDFYLLIRIGAAMGFFNMFIGVLIAAILGFRLLQFRSWTLWHRLQLSLRRGEHPAREVLDSAIVMGAALLLILPGFISDLLALICLIPVSRHRLAAYLEKHGEMLMSTRAPQPTDAHTIDGVFRRED